MTFMSFCGIFQSCVENSGSLPWRFEFKEFPQNLYVNDCETRNASRRIQKTLFMMSNFCMLQVLKKS